MSSDILIVALFLWVKIRSFLTQSIFIIGKAHPVEAEKKDVDLILNASDK